MGGQDAHPTSKFSLCGTGILPVSYAAGMPTPHQNFLFVEQASCLCLMRARCPPHIKIFSLWNRHLACILMPQIQLGRVKT